MTFTSAPIWLHAVPLTWVPILGSHCLLNITAFVPFAQILPQIIALFSIVAWISLPLSFNVLSQILILPRNHSKKYPHIKVFYLYPKICISENIKGKSVLIVKTCFLDLKKPIF